MIRNGKPQDIESIVDIAVESVSQNPIPVRIDRDAMRDAAEDCLSPSNFLMVSEIDGVVVGAVAAVSQPSFWFQRQQCSVLLYYSRTTGEGLKLLRAFAEWVKSRPAIKVAVLECEPETDPRLFDFMGNLGFSRRSTNLVYVRNLVEGENAFIT